MASANRLSGLVIQAFEKDFHLYSPAVMLLPAALLSLTLASLFFVMLHLRAPRWSYLVPGVLPTAIPLFALPNVRVYGYHGFLQAGIVYRILAGEVPPLSPLLAGQPGTHPWGGALVLAGIARLFGISGAEPTADALAAVAASAPHAYLVLRPGSAAWARRPTLPVVFENSAAAVLELPR
jgi:hypothetical protein